MLIDALHEDDAWNFRWHYPKCWWFIVKLRMTPLPTLSFHRLGHNLLCSSIRDLLTYTVVWSVNFLYFISSGNGVGIVKGTFIISHISSFHSLSVQVIKLYVCVASRVPCNITTLFILVIKIHFKECQVFENLDEDIHGTCTKDPKGSTSSFELLVHITSFISDSCTWIPESCMLPPTSLQLLELWLI